MEVRPKFPGRQWFLWPRIAWLRGGVLTGLGLSCVLVAWLVVANRVVALEPYSDSRNLVSGGILVLVMAIPVLRFRDQPGKLVAAGLASWTLVSFTYLAAELYFTLLKNRMGAFHFFMLGAVSYGMVAVLDWVLLMCAAARHAHMAHVRDRTASVLRHRT